MFARLLALSLLLAVSACSTGSSPTLPIPPPTALSSAPDANGLVTITGSGAIEGAMVLAYNERLESGSITVADDMGDFSVQVAAAIGDSIVVWQRVGTDSSQLVTVVVPSM